MSTVSVISVDHVFFSLLLHFTTSGPKEFRLQGKIYRRTDFQLKNKRNLNIECSHFEPVKRVAAQLPCVVYLHGNCSSRIEALPAVEVLLPSNITLFCLDFSGCGLSEGQYISLGWYERDDVEAVIDYLRSSNSVSAIGLWGRSMGAVTSIMHVDRDPSIAGVVLDSPFADLRLLAEELCKNHTKLPKFIVSGAMSIIRKTIQGRANFDINDLVPMNHAQSGFMPALFVAANDDTFILPHHTKDLHAKYSGDKNLIMVDGDHNSVRPQFLLDSISIFFYNTLLCDSLPKDKDKGDKSTKLKDSPGLAEKYMKHNQEMTSGKKIGNEEQVGEMLDDFGEEELQKAMEESMRLAQEDENKGQGHLLMGGGKLETTGMSPQNLGDSGVKPSKAGEQNKMAAEAGLDDDFDILASDSSNMYTKGEESKEGM